MQIAEEMNRYGYLGPYDWKILDRILLIEVCVIYLVIHYILIACIDVIDSAVILVIAFVLKLGFSCGKEALPFW